MPIPQRINQEFRDYTLVGKKATLPEYNLGQGCFRLDLPFLFQVSYLGGRNFLGGQVLDFLIFTPLATPVQVFGRYWHEGQMSSKDRYNLAVLSALLRKEIIVAWSDDLLTIEAAVAFLNTNVT